MEVLPNYLLLSRCCSGKIPLLVGMAGDEKASSCDKTTFEIYRPQWSCFEASDKVEKEEENEEFNVALSHQVSRLVSED